VATKQRLGKLPGMPSDLCANWLTRLQADGFHPLAITTVHALGAGHLSSDHRDPFDRMLAAHALSENATSVTADPALNSFRCAMLC